MIIDIFNAEKTNQIREIKDTLKLYLRVFVIDSCHVSESLVTGDVPETSRN